MTNPVSNVTIATSGANVTQQRQNLGRTEIWGVQSDAEYRLGSSWRVVGAYLFNHATVKENAANPAVVGKYIPQVPTHRGSLQVAYSNAKLATVALGVQVTGRQFDDDQNLRTVPGEADPGLPGYAVADLKVSRTLTRSLDVFFGIQNMFDQQYVVGTLPTTVGSPRLVNGGARIRFGGR
jgi:outer membrane receptor protein involved in Fe transport